MTQNSTLQGLNIVSSGEIIIKEGVIKDSSPIILTSDDSSMIIQNSEISGSKNDHYVQAQPFSNIEWGTLEDNTEVAIKGDLIYLSKQLGSGYLLSAYFRNSPLLSIKDFQKLIDWLKTGNYLAFQAAQKNNCNDWA
mgnify:CR=1 FL=1